MNITSVPASAPDSIVSLPPISRVRLLMFASPLCPFPTGESGSMPIPLSLTRNTSAEPSAPILTLAL